MIQFDLETRQFARMPGYVASVGVGAIGGNVTARLTEGKLKAKMKEEGKSDAEIREALKNRRRSLTGTGALAGGGARFIGGRIRDAVAK